MLPNRLLKGFGALSFSLSLLAGCASPVTILPTETTPVVVAENPPAAQPAAPAAVAPTTLDGKVIFKGQPVAGYAVTIYDARTNLPVERKADLNGASGLAVLDQNLTTDDQGGFKLQVVGLAPGQALRVVATKGKSSLEAIVSSDLQTLGAKQRRVLAADVTLTLSELTTAMAKVARNVVLTTQVLTPEAAAPVIAKLMADMETLSAKLDEQLKQLPAMADELTQAESPDTIGKAEAGALNVLINNAGLLKETTKVVAELVAEVAKQSKDPATRSAAAADPKLIEALAKVQYVGTVLTGALDGTDGTFSLVNGVTGGKIDASTGIGTIADRVTPNRHSAPAVQTPVTRSAHVTNEQELQLALQDASTTTIYLDNTITLTNDSTLNIDHAVTIDGGLSKYFLNSDFDHPATIKVKSAGVTMKSLVFRSLVVVGAEASGEGATFESVVFHHLMANSETCVTVEAQGKATFSVCQFTKFSSLAAQGIAAAGEIEVEGTTFTNFNKAISIAPSTSLAPQITDCIFAGNVTSIYFEDGNINQTHVDGITDNNIGLTTNGISFEAADGATFDSIEEALLGPDANNPTVNDFITTTNLLFWRNGQ